MELDLEQKRLLFALAHADGWVSAEELGSALGWHRKRVRQGVAQLRRVLGDETSVESQPRRGYRMAALSDEVRRLIINDERYNESRFHLDERRSVIALHLLFCPGWASMEAIAGALFLSKTTVFEEVHQLERWFGRMGNLTLEVSRQHGVRVQGSERSKRFACVSFAQLRILRLMGCSEVELRGFMSVTERAARLLARDLVASGTWVSGEELSHTTRYIAISWLRDVRGFKLEGPLGGADPARYPCLHDLAEGMDPPLNACERQAVASLLDHGDMLRNPNGSFFADRARVAAIERYLADTLQLDDDRLFEDPDVVSANIARAIERVNRANQRPQYYDREMLRVAPLFVHVARRVFTDVLGVEAPRYECINLGVLIAGACARRRYRSSVRAQLVGDQDFEILDQLRASVLARLPFVPVSFDLVPCYAAESRLDDRCELKLTTSPVFHLEHPDYLLVPPLCLGDDAREIADAIDGWRTSRTADLARAIWDAGRETVRECASSLDEVVDEAVRDGATMLYLGNGALAIINMRDDLETGAQLVVVQQPIAFDHHDVTHIVALNHNSSDGDVIGWFEAALSVVL